MGISPVAGCDLGRCGFGWMGPARQAGGMISMDSDMHSPLARGFPPLARADAHSLILGSMPGQVSLQQQRYYAHPRNAFWPIIRQLLEVPADADYSRAGEVLLQHGFALWDVLASCHRPGSLDADIKPESVQANDFDAFLPAHPGIVRLLFNGATAQTLYRRHVLPQLPSRLQKLPQLRLPSTSPAHAALTLQDKLRLWQQALMPELDGGQ